jgi:predicted dehydrogenase
VRVCKEREREKGRRMACRLRLLPHPKFDADLTYRSHLVCRSSVQCHCLICRQLCDVRYRQASSHHCNPIGSFANCGDDGPQQMPWRLIPEHSGGGLLLDVGCHAIDILEWMLGSPLENVSGNAGARGAFPEVSPAQRVEDVVHLTATSAGGCLVQCSWNFATPVSEDQFIFCGAAGQLELSCFGNEPLKLTVMGDASGHNTVIDLPHDALQHVEQPLIQSIVDELRGVSGKSVCASKGDNALRCAEHMDVILNDFYGGREDNFWERQIPFKSSIRHRLTSE